MHHATAYIENLRSNGMSRSHIVSCRCTAALFRRWCGHDVDQAAARDVDTFLRRYRAAATEQRQLRTALHRFRSLCSMFRFYQLAEAVARAEAVSARRVLGVEAGRGGADWAVKALSPDDLTSVLAALDGNDSGPAWLRPVVLLFAATGCRLAEIIGLRFADIGPDCATLDVLGKGNKRRTVTVVGQQARDALAAHIAQRHAAARYTRIMPGQCVFVSTQCSKPHISPRSVQQHIGRLFALAGHAARGRNAHAFRHTFVTQAIDAGIDMHLVAEQAGHANIATTMHYTHIRPESVHNAFEKMAAGQSIHFTGAAPPRDASRAA